jgi:alpha-galactosidase/6-phospho-beta-glucosidase family protein
VVQTVGDTVGPGGLFRGLQNIPVVVEIARAMEEYCSHAVLLNLTNPLTVLTWAVSKATSIGVVGLCHELFGTLGMLSKMFDVPEEAIVQAGLTGDADLAFRTFLNDPLVCSGPDAREMFEAQREYLPQV